MIERFDLLLPTAAVLREEMLRLAWTMLPVAFLLTIFFSYFRQGYPDWADVLRRLIVVVLLLTHFHQAAELINSIGQGLANRIDNLMALEAYFSLLKAKAEEFKISPMGLLLGANEALIGVIVYLSFIIVYLARYLILALYHFYWLLYLVLAPLVILCYFFRSTAPLVGNLFKGLFQISLWPVVWAVISSMMKGLPVGQAMAAEGSFLTVIVLNFVMAFALVGTPFIVSSLTSGILVDGAQQLGAKTYQTVTQQGARLIRMSTPAGRVGTFIPKGVQSVSRKAMGGGGQ